MTDADPFALAVTMGELLDQLGIPYLVGGSVASITFGEPRLTKDLDVMIDAAEGDVRHLVARLEREFHVDADAAVDALRHRSTFSAIHIESFLRVDFFFANDLPDVRREQIRRGRTLTLASGTARFYSAEDIVAQKLRWFRMGGEVSDQQWRDVVGVIRMVRDLERQYLEQTAEAFGVRDLLERAFQDAGN